MASSDANIARSPHGNPEHDTDDGLLEASNRSRTSRSRSVRILARELSLVSHGTGNCKGDHRSIFNF
ncbi:hypothetical protein [Roseofilum sp. Belize Diploria]|uniref:hypothetical protein n=1 Tax=Roseofilum sp. Belize Diploria TaxID=2821501 RepID=UPI001B2A0B8B|nr:hypothetical protein [Roseofilum sp. Belize Diploria]MBP0009333.1 hypothetical protein [Roseofilum sp. Belize Diploria]